MKPLTGPHAFGLLPVPLPDAHASGSGGHHQQRLTNDTSQPATLTRKTPLKSAFLAIAITVAVLSAFIPVSYAIHQHLRH